MTTRWFSHVPDTRYGASMRTTLLLPVACALLAACTAPRDAAKPAADTVAAAPAAPAQAIVTAIYLWPSDTAAFEKYYPTHLKLVADHQAEIGFTRVERTKFTTDLQGGKPQYYRQAELYFPSMEAARAGIGTAGFKAVGEDFKNFVAKDGVLLMVAEETETASEAPCPALATVLYGTPQDAAAFESYYPKHLDIVRANAADIGFTRADLTRFTSNLDGGPPTLHRQAELCFSDMEALKRGIGSQGFGRVGNDFQNFSTGGQRGMIGVQD
jgi:uncharacterized protein (TIGR02118 family)